MRRLLALAAGLALVLTMAGSTLAAPGHVVIGTGWRLTNDNVPTVQFTVAAQISSSKAIGTYVFDPLGGLRFTVALSCGAVDGDTAVVGGRIASTTDPDLDGALVYVFIVDGGPSVFGEYGPDSITLTAIGPEGAGTDFPVDFPAHCPLARGDTFDQLVGLYGLRTVLGDTLVR